MMKSNYTDAFKEQAMQKVLQRGDKTIQYIADELNINYHTLKNWLKSDQKDPMNKEPMNKRPEDWTLEERFKILLESSALEGEALNAFCRRKGLFNHHLETWEKAFVSPRKKPTDSLSDRDLRTEVKQLKKELDRKEKALAEAAALLVLQKKFNAFWEEKG